MSVDYRPNYDPADVDHDYGHTGGDITVPTFQGNTKPFRFWCQKALPLVYDDSLSYYEVLCKMADYLNNFMTDLTTVEDSMTEFGQQFVLNQQFLNSMADQLGQNVADLEAYINDRMEDFMTAYTQLQTYVNTYFDNLDVQAEINNKLDTMASDGTLNDLFDPVLETWMQQKTAQIDAAIDEQNAVQAQQNGRISVLEGRMDTFDGLPAGSTAGNAELIGIRTNFLGEVYPTAGDAVRSSDMIASGFDSIPFTRLEEWNGNKAASVYDTLQIDVSAYKGGRVIMIANMEGFESAVVDIGVGVYATNVSGKTADQDAHAYILGSNVFVNYSVIPTDISGEERIALYFNIPDNFSYQYLKMGFVEPIPIQDYTQPAAIVYATSWSKTKVDPTLTNAGEAADAKATGDALDELNERLGDEIADVKTTLNELIEVKSSTNACNPNTLEVGLLNVSGVVDPSYTTRVTTEYIPVKGLYVSAYCHEDGYSDSAPVRIAFYNNDKTLKNIITVNPAITLAVDGASFVRVSFAYNWASYYVGFSNNNEKLPFEEYAPDTASIKETALPSRITATDNWIYKFAECSFVGGNVHLSIDDVSSALYELVSNPPASIWDTSFFGQLKTWHDTYGVCITCNCFSFLSTLASYDIANIPNTWATEFVTAKSWLKFAFHSKNNNTTYNTASTLKTDYEYFVSAIYHMTGDYDCIDTGTRLQSYAGTKSQILETMAVNHGITMLWTAEDNRNSYYFDNAQTERVNNRSKYIDDVNNILFIRSMPRLDNKTIDDIIALISTKPQYGKMVEIFCHENLEGGIASGTITRVNNALAWFTANGYESHFLTDIFI